MGYSKQLGFDVSEVSGATRADFEDLVNRGAKFVVIRSSYGQHSTDSKFMEYWNYANELGLEIMAYHYSYARTPEDAVNEAINCKNFISNTGVGLSMVWYDLEEYKQPSTEIARAFLKAMGNWNCGVYASYSFINDFIDWRSLGCPIWSAQYNSTDDFGGYMWQFAGDVKVVDGLVDLNYRYIPD